MSANSAGPHERVVAIRGVSYWSRLRGPDGESRYVTQDASMGDSILLDDPQEEARLDALGCLAPVGATRQDVMNEADIRLSTYQQARRSVGGEGFS